MRSAEQACFSDVQEAPGIGLCLASLASVEVLIKKERKCFWQARMPRKMGRINYT